MNKESIFNFKDREFNNTTEFVESVHKEISVRDLVVAMGYLRDDEFYKGDKIRCVFHNEKTPSLQVSDSFFKCYGCGVKGDIFKWVGEFDSLCFLESVEKVATFLGVKIKEAKYVSLKPMRDNLSKQWAYYTSKYKEIISEKSEKGALVLEKGKGFFPLQVGYDPAKNYLVFQFTNKQGNTVGFTKRRIIETDEPKWDHSSLEKSLISECKNIFNLGGAYKSIKKEKQAIFVEGPRDVSSVIKSGIDYVVSVSGTNNFNNSVLDILMPLNSIIFFYDGDEAGIKASRSSIIALLKYKPLMLLETFIAMNESGKDPGDCSKEEIKTAIQNKKQSIEWFVQNSSLDECAEFYSNINSSIVEPIFLSHFNKKMCYRTSQSIEVLNSRIKQKSKDVNKSDYKTRLMATAGIIYDEGIELLDMNQEEALKILELRYNK